MDSELLQSLICVIVIIGFFAGILFVGVWLDEKKGRKARTNKLIEALNIENKNMMTIICDLEIKVDTLMELSIGKIKRNYQVE